MLLNIILRKSTKIANFGIPNLQDFFFRIDSDFFFGLIRPSLWRYLRWPFLYLLGTYYITMSSTITFGYRIRCYWFLWSSLQRSCPENRKSGSRCRLQHLVWRCRGRRIHQTYPKVSTYFSLLNPSETFPTNTIFLTSCIALFLIWLHFSLFFSHFFKELILTQSIFASSWKHALLRMTEMPKSHHLLLAPNLDPRVEYCHSCGYF